MRSLPEKDFWDMLRTRLRNYEEQPTNDDDWELIAAALKPTPWYKRKSVVVLALLLLLSGAAVWVMLPSGKEGNALAKNNAVPATEVPSTGAASPRADRNQSMAGEEKSDPSKQNNNTSQAGQNTPAVTAEQPNGNAASTAASSPVASGAGITQVTGHDERDNIRQRSTKAQAKAQADQHAENNEEALSASHAAATARNGTHNASMKTVDKPVATPPAQQPGAAIKQTSVYRSAANAPASPAHSETGNRTAVSDQPIVASGKNGSVTTGAATNAGPATNGEAQSSDLVTNGGARNSGFASNDDTRNSVSAPNGPGISKGSAKPRITDTTHTNIATANTTANDTVKRNGTVLHGSGIADQAAVSPVVNKDSTIVKAGDNKHAPAKTAKEEEQKRKAWHPMLYFSLTPSLAFQKVTPMRNDDIHISGLQEQSLVSGNRAGIGMETGGQVTLLKGFDLYGGLAYYQQNQSITYNYTLPSSTNVSAQESMNYVITPEGGSHKFRYAMRNAGVSAGFLYTVKDAKLMHKIGAGLQYQRGFMKARGGDTYENSGSQYLNYQVHYRLEWAATRAGRTRLFVQPAFIHSFWSHETLREPLTVKPYRVGLSFGLNVAF